MRNLALAWPGYTDDWRYGFILAGVESSFVTA